MVKEPNRTRKMRDCCIKMIEENNKILNKRNRLSIHNGIKHFLKSYEETEIEIEDEDGEFF